jgi:hypothetical protein
LADQFEISSNIFWMLIHNVIATPPHPPVESSKNDKPYDRMLGLFWSQI